ncbi:MAG TPA: nucleoside transporter C-terminal domain-containing protein [Oculatellaceae cyanobacterium]|jgi:CNT family concentrative nucleoside transporter
MTQWTGLIGILALLLTAYLMSSKRSAINWRLVVSGLGLQVLLAVFCLKIPFGRELFHRLGQGIEKLLSFSDSGASFVFGFLVGKPDRINELFGAGSSFIFAFKLVPTIIFVASLVSIAYHLGLMQRVVKLVAWVVYKIMGASGSEALSNAASIFVGQIEAQLMVKPYLSTMTRSELLAVMSGSMACISGGVMAVYIQMGIPAEYLLAASLMSVPGALVISKLVLPETEPSLTRGEVRIELEKDSVNLIDAAARGASEGMKIGLNVCAMLIGFIALINLMDYGIAQAGLALNRLGLDLSIVGLDARHLSLNAILGSAFSVVALALGVPAQDAHFVGGLMGTKMVVNEFVAYAALAPTKANLDPKSLAIASFALCGFANFSSVAMQIGGIGEMAPTRKRDLAELGMQALLCGTLASYMSSALAGLLIGLDQSDSASTFAGGIMLLSLAAIFGARYLPGGRKGQQAPSATAT